MSDLFGDDAPPTAPARTERAPPADAARPLADRLRPTRLAEVVGQEHLTGPDGALTRLVAARTLGSLVFWGPPGTGKTTVARLLAGEVELEFEQVSAIFSGVAELRRVFEAARARRAAGRGTLLFVDEIHRFNRAQQDAFLPVVEDGTVTLVGATTENPSFALNAALMSRARVLTFRRLDEAALERLAARAEAVERRAIPLDAAARAVLLRFADGDGRALLTLVDDLWRATRAGETLDPAALGRLLQRRAPVYDKDRDGHYDLISALHKAVRGSDPDAALYWFCRMLEGGEDPRFLARRLVRMAIEDVGLADREALVHAEAAARTYERLGSPEGELALANVVISLAAGPKSNAAYVAYKAGRKAAADTGSLKPPAHILNAPTAFMRREGFGQGYAYDHDVAGGISGQNYFPAEMERRRFYEPTGNGAEASLRERLEELARRREALERSAPADAAKPPKGSRA